MRRMKQRTSPAPLTMGKLVEVDGDAPEIKHGDGYRGNQSMQWQLMGTEFKVAMRCKCGRWWGWVREHVAAGLFETLQRDGCVGCT